MPNQIIRTASARTRVAVRSPAKIFAGGLGQAMDLGGTLNSCDADHLMEIYEELRARRLAAPTGQEADAAAIAGDWSTVGQLIYHAMGHVAGEAGPARTR